MRKIENLIEYPLPEMLYSDIHWWMWAIKAFPRMKIKYRIIKATNYRD
jgi:hypothetical protein